jgi:hypothetical protein
MGAGFTLGYCDGRAATRKAVEVAPARVVLRRGQHVTARRRARTQLRVRSHTRARARRSYAGVSRKGVGADPPVNFLSDGGDTVRPAQLDFGDCRERVLGWFYVAMRVQNLEQMVKGLPDNAIRRSQSTITLTISAHRAPALARSIAGNHAYSRNRFTRVRRRWSREPSRPSASYLEPPAGSLNGGRR